MSDQPADTLPPPIVVPCRDGEMESLLEKEWLLANRIGAYACSTVVGCNTRRYHGLLAAAVRPPACRVMALATVLEELVIDEKAYPLSTFEFPGTFSPRGMAHLAEFRNDATATFLFRAGPAELLKEVLLADAANAVAVRYTLRGARGTLRLWPFTAMRDYHSLRRVHEPHQMTFQAADSGVRVTDMMRAEHCLCVAAEGGVFHPRPQWWYRFTYRADIARGQEGLEDLYTPGEFACELGEGATVQLTASLDEPRRLDFTETAAKRGTRLAALAAAVGPKAEEPTRRLAVATDAFVVQRGTPGAQPSTTIVAGYPWFADWGRDAMVSLPGLLLATGRFAEAREVFRTFAAALSEGMIPNLFDEYSGEARYNSIDASLWFIVAAERYLQAAGDMASWRETLLPAARCIVRAYHDGTRFGIHADADGLLTGGSADTQLTWMDVKLASEAVTPRHGKAVEVNALWYNALRILAERCRGLDDGLSRQCAQEAERVRAAFSRVFWNESAGCLYDCVTEGRPDESIRPNQILAVSLPCSPLPHTQQAGVVRVVREKLLTPMGLRTLAREDGRYRRRYGGSWESRDRAYHQGTVWAWLIGPFIEAYLKVERRKAFAVEQARQWLSAFDAHLAEAGVGQISEIFDGDEPHTPRGCIAQAWSVAEVLRAKLLVQQGGAG